MAEDKNKKTNNNLKTDKIKALEKQDVGNKETVSNKESEKDFKNNAVNKKVDAGNLEKAESKSETKINSNKEIKKDSLKEDSQKNNDKTKKLDKPKTENNLKFSESSKNTKKKEKSSNLSKSNKSTDENNEFIEKLVSINRVAKVVKGGRRFSFAALVVVGDGNGKVGHGKGKAKEVPEAIKKATDEAKLNMLRVPLRQGRTLHHDISGRFDSGRVFLRSAPSGTGVIAGGPMRAVFEALGIQDIVAKSVGSSNPHNMIRATFKALESVSSPKLIAIRRGLKINDITKRRKNANINFEGNQDA